MKLTSVEIHADNSSDIISLSFRDPGRFNPYNVKSILGLDAEDISSTYYGSYNGSKLYNIKLKSRVVTIKVGLNPLYSGGVSYSDLRDSIYKLISSSRTGLIQLQFKNGNSVTAILNGYISKVDALQFEKTQDMQLTITSDYPMLRGPGQVILNRWDLPPATSLITDSISTAPHGAVFNIVINSETNYVNIASFEDSSWLFAITNRDGFIPGDTISISSDYDKYVTYTRNGYTYSIANLVDAGSFWPVIFPGDNTFALIDQYGNSLKMYWDSISYYPAYWGI